jgi:hypothetical protein
MAVPSFSLAGDNFFKENNPDIDKYVFAKSYIMALSYYSRVADRLKTEDQASLQAEPDLKAIQRVIDHRTLDNTDLRISKSYLWKYADSRNMFIRKVSSEAGAVYNRLVLMSAQERELWKAFYAAKRSGRAGEELQSDFTARQVALARQKKEVAKELVTQSAFLAKILLSARDCEDENCKVLSLTRDERDRLVKRLDSFARTKMDWGLKPGQSTLDASVAVIREVLEDSIYLSRP